MAALLLSAGLLLTGCGSGESGDSNGETPADEAPGVVDESVATQSPS